MVRRALNMLAVRWTQDACPHLRIDFDIPKDRSQQHISVSHVNREYPQASSDEAACHHARAVDNQPTSITALAAEVDCRAIVPSVEARVIILVLVLIRR